MELVVIIIAAGFSNSALNQKTILMIIDLVVEKIRVLQLIY